MNIRRPLPVTVAAVLLAPLSLLYLIFPLLPTEGVPALVVYSNVVWGVAGLVAAAGLWMLKRWSMWLAIVLCVLAYFASPNLAAPAQVFPTLTDREREILNLIAQGHPNPAIARQLLLSTKTVGNYVSNIFTKLQVADRAQAIIRAREAGLG